MDDEQLEKVVEAPRAWGSEDLVEALEHLEEHDMDEGYEAVDEELRRRGRGPGNRRRENEGADHNGTPFNDVQVSPFSSGYGVKGSAMFPQWKPAGLKGEGDDE